MIWYLNPQENNVPPHSYTIKNGRFLRTNETIPTKILLILESGCTYSSFQMEIKRWRTWFISNKIERETYKKRKRSNALLQPLLTLNLILWKKSHDKCKSSCYSFQIIFLYLRLFWFLSRIFTVIAHNGFELRNLSLFINKLVSHWRCNPCLCASTPVL